MLRNPPPWFYRRGHRRGDAIRPNITSQPTNTTVDAGTTATFTVVATGIFSSEFRYSWEVSTNGGTSWTPIPNEGAATYDFTATNEDNNKNYRVTVIGRSGRVVSDVVTLTVTPVAASSDIRLIVGNSASLTADDLYWQDLLTTLGYSVTVMDDSAAEVTTASGATGALVSSSNVEGTLLAKWDGQGALSVPVFHTRHTNWDNAGHAVTGAATSTGITLVQYLSSTPFEWSGKTVGQDYTAFSSAANVLERTAAGLGSGAVKMLSHATATTDFLMWCYDVGASLYTGTADARIVNFAPAVGYASSIHSDFESFLREAFEWVFGAPGGAPAAAPTITAHPAAVSGLRGTTGVFEVQATGDTPLTYQWQFNGTGSWVNISGATAATYQRLLLITDNGDSVRCVVTNGAGSATSNEAALTVAEPPTSTEWGVLAARCATQWPTSGDYIGGEGKQWARGFSRSASNPDVIMFTHDVAGVWRSEDGGETWKLKRNRNFPLMGASIAICPNDPDRVVAFGSEGWNRNVVQDLDGIHLSLDGGDTWNLVQYTQINQFGSVISTATRTSREVQANIWWVSNTKVFAFSDGNGVGDSNKLFVSTDSGASWSVRSSAFTVTQKCDVHRLISNLSTATTLYMAGAYGLYTSTDDGVTWSVLAFAGTDVRWIERHPSVASTLYATTRTGLYRSTNSGTSWTLIRSAANARYFAISPANADVWWLSGDSRSGQPQTSCGPQISTASFNNGIDSSGLAIVTNDGGTTWRKATVNSGTLCGDASSFDYSTRGMQVFASPHPNVAGEWSIHAGANFYQSTDLDGSAPSFNYASHGFAGNNWGMYGYSGFIWDPSDPDWVAYAIADEGYVVTTDGGQTTTQYDLPEINGFGEAHSGAADAGHGVVIVCNGQNNDALGIARSTDGGVTWSQIVSTATDRQFVACKTGTSGGSGVWFCTNLKSTNGGVTWSSMTFATVNGFSGWQVTDYFQVGGTHVLWATDSTGKRVQRSTNDGVTWTASPWANATSPRPNKSKHVRADKGNSDRFWTLTQGNKQLVLVDFSTGNIIRTCNPLAVLGVRTKAEIENFEICPIDPNTLYAVSSLTDKGLIARSTDGGLTWENWTANLPGSGIARSIRVHPLTGDVHTGRDTGTWVRTGNTGAQPTWHGTGVLTVY